MATNAMNVFSFTPSAELNNKFEKRLSNSSFLDIRTVTITLCIKYLEMIANIFDC